MSPSTEGSSPKKHQKTGHKASLEADAIGQQADDQAHGHTSQLNDGEEKARLNQGHAQQITKRRQGGKQLGDMERGTYPGTHDNNGGSHAVVDAGFYRAHDSRRLPVNRSCSRAAKRSVMPAI